MDNHLVFCLSINQQRVLRKYSAPENERAIIKSVPLGGEFELAVSALRDMGIKFRVRYRGPRYDGMRLTTRKRHAHSASLYKI